MSERFCGKIRPYLDSDYAIDQTGHLIYWDAVRKEHRLLEPATPIDDPHIVIGKVGQQNLHPNHLSLKPKDLECIDVTDEAGIPVGEPVLPGLSTFLFWGTGHSKQDRLSILTQSHLSREATPKNRLYITQTEDVYKAGWTPIFAPLINRSFSIYNPLHVILVPNSILESGKFADAHEAEKTALVQSFVRLDDFRG